jgi:hypothetical protein
MSLLTTKNNLRTLEQVKLYKDNYKSMRIIQGDAKSERIYKMFTVIESIFQQDKMVEYVQAKYKGEHLRETCITKVYRIKGQLIRRDHVRMVWDNQEEIICYEDSKGNHWKREWGVEMPYDIQGLITFRNKESRVQILGVGYYRGEKVIRYPGRMYGLTKQYMRSSLWDTLSKWGAI